MARSTGSADLTVAPLDSLDRLSLNQITTNLLNMDEAIAACESHAIPWIAAWRHKLEQDVPAIRRRIENAGLRVSSLCRGGMFPAGTESERKKRIEDNMRAVDEAADLGTDVLVLVNGPAPDRDLDGARQMVLDGIAEVAPYARKRGVRLGIEPLHPMFAGDRSVVVTLNQANRMAEKFDAAEVGVVIDVYHVWWDPEVYSEIERAAGRILGFHVSDWMVPTTSLLMGRGMMGTGVIELRRLRNVVQRAGYRGPIEVEIFNQEIWNMPARRSLEWMKDAYLEHC